MDEARYQYIEDFGILFEEFGGGRMVGRVLGLLMIADPPTQSAETIAAALHASRGSISQATRIIVQLGMVRRFTRPGERRDYFELRPDAWSETSRRRGGELDRMIDIFERGLRLTANGDLPPPAHLLESLAFMQFWKRTFTDLFPAWEADRERLIGEQRDRYP